MSEPETLLTIGELAARLTEPGLSPDPIATQLRHNAQKNLIHSFESKGSGRTASRLYREDQWLVAKVLGILTEFGFADLSVHHAASVALTAWNFQDTSRPARSPAQWVIDDFRKGVDFWTFDLTLFRHITKGGRDVRARIHNVKDDRGTSYGLGEEYIPRAVTMIDLTPHLNRLFGDKSGMH